MILYIDPAASSYLITAIAGIIVAIGTGIGIWFRRTKKKVQEKLGVDEREKKEMESDDIVINDKEE